MKRIPVFVRLRRAMLIGVNDHSPRRIEDLLSQGVEVRLFCQRVPIALLPQVVDGFVRHSRQMPRAEDLADVDALFIQTGDPVTDSAWQSMAKEQGVQVVLVENLRPEAFQPETFCCGPFALTIHPVRPLRALRRQLRRLQRLWRQARLVRPRTARRDVARPGLDA